MERDSTNTRSVLVVDVFNLLADASATRRFNISVIRRVSAMLCTQTIPESTTCLVPHSTVAVIRKREFFRAHSACYHCVASDRSLLPLRRARVQAASNMHQVLSTHLPLQSALLHVFSKTPKWLTNIPQVCFHSSSNRTSGARTYLQPPSDTGCRVHRIR